MEKKRNNYVLRCRELIPGIFSQKKLRIPVLYDKMQKEEEKNKANRKKGKIYEKRN